MKKTKPWQNIDLDTILCGEFSLYSYIFKKFASISVVIFLVNLLQLQTMTTFMPPPPAATFLAFHPQDNNIIAIGMEDSSIQIYNVRVDEVLLYLNLNAWLKFVNKLWAYGIYNNLHAPFLQVKTKLKGHQKRITGLAFSHALNVLVSSGADSQV